MDDIIYTASREALLTRDYIDDLGAWLRRVPGSREEFTEEATDVLNGFYECGGKLVTGEGQPIPITAGIFDHVHSECSYGEWISEQRRREKAERAPRKTLLGRLQIYDAVGIISGRTVRKELRRADVAEMRELLGRFNRVWRIRYVRELKKIIAAHDGKSSLSYGAAVRRLRLRFKAELDLWEAQQ